MQIILQQKCMQKLLLTAVRVCMSNEYCDIFKLQLYDDLIQQHQKHGILQDFYLALMTLRVLGSMQLTLQSVTPASLQMEIENRP